MSDPTPVTLPERTTSRPPARAARAAPIARRWRGSCSTTPSIGSGTVQGLHPYYDVFLSCDNGAFTARTGASHSVTALAGSPQNVIFGGANGSPGTSDISWRFHDQGMTILDPAGGAACVFDPPDAAVEPNSIGIEQEWTASPAAGITCTLREEIVAFGTTEADSGVRLTLATTTSAASFGDVNVGVRWQIDYQNAATPAHREPVRGPIRALAPARTRSLIAGPRAPHPATASP